MIELVHKPHEGNLVAWARNRPDVLVLSGDLTGSTEIQLFKDTYPERFFSMGMAEQNMLSWAGGLAREGFVPFLHTFAVFLYRRPLDQLEMSVCYPNLPVRLVGFLPGLNTPGGVTHQAINDIGVLRAIPNLTILEMGDATDVETVLDLTEEIPGPIYVRMLRGDVARLFPANERIRLNSARVVREGDDLALITSGHCTSEAMPATAALARRGVAIRHLHVSTLKPFSDPLVEETIAVSGRGVITMENHLVTGGLGSAVAEMMAEKRIGGPLYRIGIRDTYAQGASFPYLLRKHGIDAMALVDKVETILGENFRLTEDDLQAESVPVYPPSQVDERQVSERLEAL